MEFSIGLELQTAHHFCERPAFQNERFQKNVVFSVSFQDKKLFHVEIDGKDLEFVTSPFSYQQKESFGSALKNIALIANVLRERRPRDFESWIKDILPKTDCTIETGEIYDQVKDILFEYPDQAKFLVSYNPQFTIGCALKELVPLYLGFFGFKPHVNPMVNFIGALPFLDQLKDLAKNDDSDLSFRDHMTRYVYNDKTGLIFLHALTLYCLTPHHINGVESALESDIKAIKATYLDCIHNNWQALQLDAKQKLLWMSRRPFSDMFQGLEDNGEKDNFILFYQLSMLKFNRLFSEIHNIPRNFTYTNYGDNYVSKDGKAIDLREIAFKYDFWERIEKEDLKEKLLDLLKHGVLTTAMIRHFMKKGQKVPRDKNIIDNEYLECGDFQKLDAQNNLEAAFHSALTFYFDYAVSSIVKIDEKWKGSIRKIFYPGNLQKEILIANYSEDAISPPWFLPESDAMGYYNNKRLGYNFKSNWALVETRGVQKLSEYFFRKISMAPPMGGFLCQNQTLLKEGISLFDFLTNLDIDDIFNECRKILR